MTIKYSKLYKFINIKFKCHNKYFISLCNIYLYIIKFIYIYFIHNICYMYYIFIFT